MFENLPCSIDTVLVHVKNVGSNSVNQPNPLGALGDWTTNQIVHMEGPIALAAYVAEDSLLGHQREKRPLGLMVLDAPV